MIQLYNDVCMTLAPKKPPTTITTSIEDERNQLICMMKAVDRVMKTSNLYNLWEEYQTDILEAFERWTECNSREDADEIAK